MALVFKWLPVSIELLLRLTPGAVRGGGSVCPRPYPVALRFEPIVVESALMLSEFLVCPLSTLGRLLDGGYEPNRIPLFR